MRASGLWQLIPPCSTGQSRQATTCLTSCPRWANGSWRKIAGSAGSFFSMLSLIMETYGPGAELSSVRRAELLAKLAKLGGDKEISWDYWESLVDDAA